MNSKEEKEALEKEGAKDLDEILEQVTEQFEYDSMPSHELGVQVTPEDFLADRGTKIA